MNTVRIAAAVVALLVGVVWLGQGLGFVGGSPMTGSSFWAIAGIFLIAVAAWLGWTASRRSRPG